ncbi:GlxA family transcriptional regulator [Microvirga sp. VF16]|uniref:GlxA family transcriptional regulator n=1 Tax=Microvirga sp. VF16 TaxID=2807101 RepID=UPI00193CA338|nr:helix-turn-helix domain-containing protein [Microvirga sp. VF16]QRM34314.1 helix-turn-helix domain-containing protein [Microvirga sp. VF16]
MPEMARPLHISLVAIPDAVISTLTGIYDVLGSFRMLGRLEPSIPESPPFTVEIVAIERGNVALASGVPVQAHRSVLEVAATDIIIVPSVLLGHDGWTPGRYPEIVDWARRMHTEGALLCSACSGIFLLAETGLFNGRAATVHWGYAEAFSKVFPDVPLSPERVLVVSGEREEYITSGASMTWHDLVLYLIARHVGATAAQTVARYFALQWHHDGLAPYIVFQGRRDHGDAAIAEAQAWLSTHFSIAGPVEEMVRRSVLPERTFKRRFTEATGFTPIDYVQRLRIEDAKRRLERTDEPADEISWRVGYEDPAFFRRLFKRVTGMTPSAYRRRFQVPTFARSKAGRSST